MTAGSDPTPVALLLARAHIATGRWDEAGRVLAPHLAAAPEDPEALSLSAVVLLGTGRFEEGLHAAGQAALLDPDAEWPRRLTSVAQLALGRHRLARAAADAATAAAPGAWEPRVQRCAVDVAENRVTAATWEAARAAVRLAPWEPATHTALGRVALAGHRTREAEAAFAQAMRLDPADAVARTRLAQVDLHRRRVGEAVRGFRAAGALDPSDPEALRGTAVAFLRGARMVGTLLVLGLFACYAARTLQPGGPGRVIGAVLTVLVLALVVALSVRVFRRTGRLPGPLVRVVLRARPEIAAWLLLGAFAEAVAWTAAVAHDPVGRGVLVVGSALAAVAVWLMRVARSMRWFGAWNRRFRGFG